MSKSREHFEKAAQIAPRYLENLVLFADFYARKANDRALFVRLLSQVVDGSPQQGDPDWLPEQRLACAKAKKLLTQVDQIFGPPPPPAGGQG